MIRIYTQLEQGQEWLRRYRGCSPLFACVLGFTETGLIPGISAAGATPEARRYTALADAEFLYCGPVPQPQYPLPPLLAGASPVLISRAVVEALSLPYLYLFNAGLPKPPTVPVIDLGGTPASCLSQGRAMSLATVKHIFEQGLIWGQELVRATEGYLILGECVVGGTTTALAVLTGLGLAAAGKVNSSHPICNHAQKWAVVQSGLQQAGFWSPSSGVLCPELIHSVKDPLSLVAAVGDPMQVAAAAIAIAASRSTGVLLAGGTQMLAVYALMQAIAKEYSLAWQPEQVLVGTTRWVAEDPTGHTVELAQLIKNVPLIATQLSFAASRYEQLRAYEQGYVKEGVGAGGLCLAAHLTLGWNQTQLLHSIESLVERWTQIEFRV